jgi:putative DNA primase/helicase
MSVLCSGLAANAAVDESLGRATASTARSIESDTFVGGALTLARSLMVGDKLAFDADPWLINVRNGVVDLRSGALMPHDPKYGMTKRAEVDYVPGAQIAGTRFEQFINEVFSADAEAVRYMQCQLGYCITGDIDIHKMFFWFGSGRNGKSTLAELMLHVMGDYARKIGSDVLMASKTERHKAELAQLLGVRMAVASEIDKGAYWDISRIKELTGDETINARFMGQNFFEFRRSVKLVVQGNNRPHLREVDYAIMARLKLVPFEVNFEKLGQLDPTLSAQLRAEAGAVFRWLVEGAMAVAAAGTKLPRCALVDGRTGDYMDDNDLIRQWINNRCVVSDELNRQNGMKVKQLLSQLLKDYKEWRIEIEGGDPSRDRSPARESSRTFSEMLNKVGADWTPTFRVSKVRDQYVALGLGLRETQRVDMGGDDDESSNVVEFKR